MKPIETYIDERIDQRASEMLTPLKEEIRSLKYEIALLKKNEIVEDFMPKTYFLEKHKISHETFRRVLNSGKVHSFYKFGKKRYNVEQMNNAIDQYKPKKPIFIPSL